jgi:signal transduction histidine kinase/CheY-like chemotaxis protein
MRRLSNVTTLSMPVSSDTEWRERLLAYVCFAIAAVLLAGPILYWAIVGNPPIIFGMIIAIGLLILSLPFIDSLSIGARSWIYCCGAIIVVVSIGLNAGFAPVFVGAYNLLLLTAGLLLGKRAMVLVTLLGVGGLVLTGVAINTGTLAIDLTGRDPGNMKNWVRIATLFAIMSLAVVYIIRFATRAVNDQYARVNRELSRAKRLRKAAEEMRDARLARERELREAQKLHAVGALSGGLAHLFNNALTVVRSVLESLNDDMSQPSRARARTRLSEAMEPAVRATRDLMIFSRREAPEPQSIEMGPMLADFAEMLGQTLPDDVNLRISTSPGLSVLMDPESLKQLLLNLVLNAADATGMHGKVQITVAPFKEQDEPNVRRAAIAVEDDGSGMDEATLSQALDPFYTDKITHSGLGLPVAHAIAVRAGGELRLESSEGIGTRVLALLPLEVARTNYDPESLWPIASALHGSTQLGTVDVPDPAEDWTDDPTPEPVWQGEVTRRLGRISATIMFILIGVVAVIVPHMRPLLLTIGPVSVALLAVAGWAKGLSVNVARVCLVFGFWILGAAVVFRAGFDNMAGMSILLIAIAWAGLLGKRRDGFIAVALTAATLLVVGAFRSGPVYYPPASNSDMAIAANWFRFAPQLALYSLTLSISVLGALAAARRGAKAEQAALERAEEMRRREADEGARLLALERTGTRSERAAAAGQAAGTIAHDLLNAVQALVGSVELLAVYEEADSDFAEVLNDLAHAVAYAEALTTQFDSISPTRDVDSHYQICSVSPRVTKIVGLMRHLLPDRIELVANIEPDLVTRISETDLRRLVYNLIANARDSIEDTGTITISLRSQNNLIALRVGDTGCGMNEATQAQIFDPFFSTKERGWGTGLGLHSVNDVVRRTLGSIDVESRLGEGSSFTVTWPVEAHKTMLQDSPPTELDQSGESRGTILLAEDEPLVRQVMAESIRRAGFDVVEAIDGDEGKQLALKKAGYVAACIDGIMPGAPSSEVIDCFQETHPGSPVLLCSGYMPAELATRGLLKSGVTLLAKPFAPSRLREELYMAIEQSA